MIHSSESTCKTTACWGTVTGVFPDVSQVCTAMLHHCIVGVQKGWQMWRIINTSCSGKRPTYWLILMHLIWERLWSTWLPCSHYAIRICYILKAILFTSVVTNSDKAVQMCQFHVAKQLPDWRHFQGNLWPNLHCIWVCHCHHNEKQQNCCIWIHIK